MALKKTGKCWSRKEQEPSRPIRGGVLSTELIAGHSPFVTSS